ncbi:MULTISPECIES: hypothetical protein [Bacteria]
MELFTQLGARRHLELEHTLSGVMNAPLVSSPILLGASDKIIKALSHRMPPPPLYYASKHIGGQRRRFHAACIFRARAISLA